MLASFLQRKEFLQTRKKQWVWKREKRFPTLILFKDPENGRAEHNARACRLFIHILCWKNARNAERRQGWRRQVLQSVAKRGGSTTTPAKRCEETRGIIVQWYAIYFLIKAKIPGIQKIISQGEGFGRMLTRRGMQQHIFVECIITFNLISLPNSRPSKLTGLKLGPFVSVPFRLSLRWFFMLRDSGHLFNYLQWYTTF